MTSPGGGARGLGLLVTAVVLIGLNLRGPIVGVPPLLATIQEDLALAPASAGLLTSLPLVAFAVVSPLVSGLAGRLGVDRTLLVSLLFLGASVGLRAWTGVGGLLVGTAVAGVAITIGNVLVPVLVRRDAGRHVPQVMALSTASYSLGQGLAVYLAVPVAAVAGWRWSVTLPAALVLLALGLWIVRMWRTGSPGRHQLPALRSTLGAGWTHVWRQGAAWWLALFFGIQSLLFYTASTWVPRQLVDTAAISQHTAGTALSIFHLVGIAGTFMVPILLRRTADARGVGSAVAAGWLVFFAGLYLFPAGWAGWMALGGIVQGAGIGLGLTLVATRPISADYGKYLSGMVQAVGYALAATGPVVIGWLADATSGWAIPTVTLVIGSLIMLVAVRRAGGNRPIGA